MDFYKADWWKFYVSDPARRIRWKIRTFFADIWHSFTGHWWCEGCHRHHGRRVVAYYLNGEDGYCFNQVREIANECAEAAEETGGGEKYADADAALEYLIQNCEFICLGREDISRRVKREFQKKASRNGNSAAHGWENEK